MPRSDNHVSDHAFDRIPDAVPDALIGAASLVVDRLGRAGHLLFRLAAPGARLVLDPPVLPWSRRPARLVEALARRGRLERTASGQALDDLVAASLPALLGHLAKVVSLTELVRQSIDLDALVADVDLDAVAAGFDVDAIAARIDIDTILSRIDLTEVVLGRVDLNAVVRAVDLDAVVRAVDLDAIIDRLDLDALANEVLTAIDLPEIIRESSGSLASETVRNVRMQSIDADRTVEGIIERLRARRYLRRGGQLPGAST